ncbi:ankyrin repeat domain-containing protein [Legionella rowbothamii]|uniref:ankyrin repeat domain-containing protein n=1 Tax=Legionella rowbothamii TaxID=96229 RepID=UPI001055D81E|nr:ankyrin repeat domain-containing protein [Legionella rowbothamii]
MTSPKQEWLIDEKINVYRINRGRVKLANTLMPGYSLGLGLLFCNFAGAKEWNKFYSLIENINAWTEDEYLLEHIRRLKETQEWRQANEKYKELLIQFPGLKSLNFRDQIQQLVASLHISPDERHCLLSVEIPRDPFMEEFIGSLDRLQNLYLWLGSQHDTDIIARSEFESYQVLPKQRLTEILQKLPANVPILMSTGRKIFALYHQLSSNEWIYYNSDHLKIISPFSNVESLSNFILNTVYKNESKGTHIPLGIIIPKQNKELVFDFSELEQLCSQFIDEKNAEQHIITTEPSDSPTDYLSPLHLAVIGNAQKNIKQLLAHGIEINAKDGLGFSPLHYATARVAKILIAHGADVNQPVTKKILLKEPSESLFHSIENVTPLYMASNFGELDKVKLLIAHGADVNAYSSTGMSPLIIAVLKGHAEVVDYLLENNAQIDSLLRTPTIPMLITPDDNILRALSFFGAVFAPFYANHTAAMCAMDNENSEILNLLIQHRDVVNEKDQYGVTLLHRAIWSSNRLLAKQLLESGADPNALSYFANSPNSLMSPLYIACQQNNFKMAQLLLQYGALTQINRAGELSCILTVIENGSLPLVTLFTEYGSNFRQLHQGVSLLDLAIRQKHYHLVDVLLAQGVEPRMSMGFISTLHLAIYQRHIPTISKILSWYVQNGIPCNEEMNISNKNIALLLNLYQSLKHALPLQKQLCSCLMNIEPADRFPIIEQAVLSPHGDKALFIKIMEVIKAQVNASPGEIISIIQTEMDADIGLSQEGKDFLEMLIQFACDYKTTMRLAS